MKHLLLFINFLFLLSSCGTSKSQDPLKGKIAVYNYEIKEYSIYINSETPIMLFDASDQFGGVYWLNKNEFLSTENFFSGINPMEKRCDIIRLDLSGNLLERVYEASKGELAWPLYTSKDDRYLLFTTHHIVDPKVHPFEGLTPMLSLAIMELGQKEVIYRIDSIGRSPNFKVEESPWLYSGYRFVFSIDDKTQLQLNEEGQRINPTTSSEGVYIFDLTTKEKKLLVPGAHTAIASPTKDQLAYQKDN